MDKYFGVPIEVRLQAINGLHRAICNNHNTSFYVRIYMSRTAVLLSDEQSTQVIAQVAFSKSTLNNSYAALLHKYPQGQPRISRAHLSEKNFPPDIALKMDEKCDKWRDNTSIYRDIN